MPFVRLRPEGVARPMPRVWRSEGDGMRRKLFGFFATMSLLLCLATCVLWVRSYWRTDAVHLAGTSADWNVRSNHAGLTVSQVVHEPSGQAQWHTSSESAYALDPSSPM